MVPRLEVAQVRNRDRAASWPHGTRREWRSGQMPRSATLRLAKRLRHSQRIVAEHPDAIQEEPAPLQHLGSLPRRMLERERGKRTSVPASPRFLPRVIEREQVLETLPAAVIWRLISGTTLIAAVPAHLVLRCPPNATRTGEGRRRGCDH